MEQQFTVTFADGVANQKYDLYFTGQFDGVLEVYMSCGYYTSDGIGEVIQRFTFGGSATGTVWSSAERCVEALGNTPDELAISGISWDATNGRWRIQIVHRTSNGNNTFLIVRSVCPGLSFSSDVQHDGCQFGLYGRYDGVGFSGSANGPHRA